MLASGPFRVLAGGAYHNLAIDKAGLLYGWGDGSFYALGNSFQTNFTPTRLFGTGLISGQPVVAADGGYYFTIALTTSGAVATWGLDTEGQAGDGGGPVQQTPFTVPLAKPAIAIAAGESHALAVDQDGTVYAWGRNLEGQIGDGKTEAIALPQAVPGIGPAVAVGAGVGFSAALLADHTVATWGDNAYGQLGDGTQEPRLRPAVVAGLDGVKAIACGRFATLALKEDGTVWGFGHVHAGLPAQLPGLQNIVAVAAGATDYFFLRGDGAVLAMGDNQSGQLGVGDKMPRPELVTVPDLPATAAIGASYTTATFAPSGVAELSSPTASKITATTAYLKVDVERTATATTVDFYVDDVLAGNAPVIQTVAPSLQYASFNATGLAPHAAHTFWAVAKNVGGLVTDHTFKASFQTLNRPPVMTAATYVLDANGKVRIPEAEVLALATDPDGDTMHIYYPPRYASFTQEVTPAGAFLVYQATGPAPANFAPRTFPIRVIDSAGAYSNEVQMQVLDLMPPTITLDASGLGNLKAGDPMPDLTALAVVHDNDPGTILAQAPPAGSILPTGPVQVRVTVADAGGNRASADATLLALPDVPTVLRTIATAQGGGGSWDYGRVGVPSIGPKGEVVFRAREGGGGFSELLAIEGPAVNGQSGYRPVNMAEFVSHYSEPVMSGTGEVAFTARITTPNGAPLGVGVFTSLGNFYNTAQRVVKTGESVPSLGGKVVRIEQIGMADDDLWLLLRVQDRRGAVQQVLAHRGQFDGLAAIVRTGAQTEVEGTNREIVAIRAFEPVKGSPGHGRGTVDGSGGTVVARLICRPNLEEIATIHADGRIEPVMAAGHDLSAATADGQGVAGKVIDLGAPSHAFPSGADRPLVAYRATLGIGGGGRRTGIFVEKAFETGAPVEAIAVEGETAPGLNEVVLRTTSDPALTLHEGGAATVAFKAILSGTGVTAANREALFAGDAAAGGARLIARLGDAAPGTEGATFADIASFTIPEWDGAGPLFKAHLNGGDSKEGDIGLWAADASGTPKLILRSGDELTVSGPSRRVRGLAVLGAMPGSMAQHRATNLLHEVALKVIFDDLSEAVVTMVIP